MPEDLSLFWSYSHFDDSGDRGRVTLLADHLADEIRVLSGRNLELFVDRKSIRWGDHWREKIDGALSASTIMVSVLSPTYFQRPECRKEFIDFYRQAESRSLDKLLLPLSYVSVSDFDTDNPDEVIAIASRYQYEDWTTLRLKDPDSESYRSGVNELAVRLLDLHRQMAQQERANSDALEANPSDPEVGFFEALRQIDKRLPEWEEAVEEDIVGRAQYDATDRVYELRLLKTPPARALAVRHRYATDELAIVEAGLALARQYSSLSIEMAPYVATVLRGASESAEARELLVPLRAAISKAIEQIRSKPLHEGGIPPAQYWQQWEYLGGVFKTLTDVHLASLRYRLEGNELVLEWHSDIERLFGT